MRRPSFAAVMEACSTALEVSRFLVEGHSTHDAAHKRELLRRFFGAPLMPLEDRLLGQLRGTYGVYALHVGLRALEDPFLPSYLARLAELQLPVYVGKAQGDDLATRLSTHRESIAATELEVDWFQARMLTYSCMTILADEIELSARAFGGLLPWNGSGFGNKALGGRRGPQRLADWDVVHPGRGREGGKEGRPLAGILARWDEKISGLPASLATYRATLALEARRSRRPRKRSGRFGASRTRRSRRIASLAI